MAAGTKSDFKIYHEEYYGGMYEALAQNVNGFNAASNGGLRLVQKELLGDYEKESFNDQIADFITRRDITSVAAVTDKKMTQDEMVSVKLNRKIGPVMQTNDAWRKIGKDEKEMSFVLGKMIATQKAHDFLESSVRAVEAALSGQTAICYDAGAYDLTVTHLASGLEKLGDMSQRVVCWVMHSYSYYSLVKTAISAKIFEEAGRVVYGATPGTLNKPVLVTDCDALRIGADSDYTTYHVLGLVAGGVVATESEDEDIVLEPVTGLENLGHRLQGEYAYNIGVKGFTWDVTNGGVNPTDNALGLASNWDKVYTDIKNCAGIRVTHT